MITLLKLAQKLIRLSLLSVVLLWSVIVSAQSIDEVVLIVDEQAITAREFSVLRIIQDQSKPYALVAPQLGEVVTDAIVDELLLAGHAKRLAPEANIPDSDVNAAISILAGRNQLSSDQLTRQLLLQGVDMQIFRESMRQRLLVQQVISQRIAQSVNISQGQVRDYIDSRPELRQLTQKKYRASHLVISIEEGASKGDISTLRELAQNVRVRLVAGASFGELISSIEQVKSSNNDGDLGWKQKGELPELFIQTLEKLKPGQLSQVIESSNGFHLLALHELESANATPQEYRVSHILKVLPPSAEGSEIAANLSNLKLQILAGVDFASIARNQSQDPGSNAAGGDLGWVSPKQLDPVFAQAMQDLKVGEVSDPIRTQFGFHLIRVQQVRDQVGIDSLETGIQQKLFAEKINEKLEDLLNDIKQIALIEVVSS